MGDLFANYPIFDAFWMTIKLTVLSAIGALIIGTAVAIMRLSPAPMVRAFGTAYVNILRNTPLTLIVLFCQMGLYVNLGFSLADKNSATFIADNTFRLGVLALSVYTASFVCEALRSGVNTVPVGQAEAARSIGLGFGQSLRHVILPQAFRAAITPLGNVLIALTKNTTVVSVIGVAEIAYVMASMNEDRPDLLYVIFGIVAAGFVILTLPMGLAVTALSRKYAVKR